MLRIYLGFNQYQVRSLREIKRYWYLVFLAYTYLKIGNLKGAFQRVFKPSVTLDTLRDLLSTFKKMSFIYLWRQLKNHYNVLFRYLQVKGRFLLKFLSPSTSPRGFNDALSLLCQPCFLITSQ